MQFPLKYINIKNDTSVSKYLADTTQVTSAVKIG